MGFVSNVLYFTVHPLHLRYILQRTLFRNSLQNHNFNNLSPTQKTCFYYLDKTGRSYSFVIKSLHAELLFPVTIFYLILRGLDTIEDDGSIDPEGKGELLRGFKDVLDIDEWRFDGCGEGVPDRDLLLYFDCVITEYKKLKRMYREILKDITGKMGAGMAKYTTKSSGIKTMSEYDEYCWYVAGIVGEGLTRLFVEGGFVDRALLERKHLHKSMGLLLQKTNIIRDVHEDYVDGRRFWPEKFWSRHVDNFDDLFKRDSVYQGKALDCSTHMVANALSHVEDCLSYLSQLNEPSIFNFCAIPQAMALATLELCFMNPELFERNLKISKGDAIGIICQVEGGGMSRLCAVVLRYIKRIEERCPPSDPYFLELRVVCAKIEKTIDMLLHSRNGESKSTQDIAVGRNLISQATNGERLFFGKVLLAGTFAVVVGAGVLAARHFSFSSGLFEV
ncbi:isoprenoid synthase domain-containing protein [Aspergillus stella-maris]|uniref:isoprenoid synthase domain-containing protein n=1 Tax=Aspergillus stella-maris TaxID=1810926 RepID=UPI003CCE2954